jgi:predicted DsbA family dithiol-disulfide isomerase
VILRDFIETGKVEWKFLPFVNGMFENSPATTAAVECVLEQSEELFATMDQRIWDDQREWKGSSDPEPLLREWAQEVGADMEIFDSCLSTGRRNDRVTSASALSRQLGVRGTPTFFLVGFPPLQGALPTETFVEVLNRVYAVATSNRE